MPTDRQLHSCLAVHLATSSFCIRIVCKPFFLPTTLSSSVSACRLGICKGQVNFLAEEHFARAAEYAIYTVDVPCALGSAYLQFSVNSVCSHGVCRTHPQARVRGDFSCFALFVEMVAHVLNPRR